MSECSRIRHVDKGFGPDAAQHDDVVMIALAADGISYVNEKQPARAKA